MKKVLAIGALVFGSMLAILQPASAADWPARTRTVMPMRSRTVVVYHRHYRHHHRPYRHYHR